MKEFSILMFIFSICIFLVGLYIYITKDIKAISWKEPYKSMKQNDIKKLGKYLMIISVVPFIISMIGMFLT